METNSSDLPTEMEGEEETIEQGLPFKEYGENSEKLRAHIEDLERQYDEREKVIDRIMEYGTGIENEKALRMYSTPVLKKWATSLEAYRASRLGK
jgi:Arc/MetJ-type ribon-helix-helix transcriptional regulator